MHLTERIDKRHRITVQRIHRWCDGVAVSPDETLKKRRLKQLLA
jgi:hypothetical protein